MFISNHLSESIKMTLWNILDCHIIFDPSLLNEWILLIGIILWLEVNILFTQFFPGLLHYSLFLGFRRTKWWPTLVGSLHWWVRYIIIVFPEWCTLIVVFSNYQSNSTNQIGSLSSLHTSMIVHFCWIWKCPISLYWRLGLKSSKNSTVCQIIRIWLDFLLFSCLS